MANPNAGGIKPFKEFIDELHASKPEHFLGMPGSRVSHEEKFSAMQAHLLKLYDGVNAQHSFVDENGSVFDCIPVEQQPGLKQSREAIPVAPDLPQAGNSVGAAKQARNTAHMQMLAADRKDQYGNVMDAPEGTIPLRRVTLENLSRFDSLQDFFKKSPLGSATPPQSGTDKPDFGSRDDGSPRATSADSDLRGADLRGADLRGMDLRSVDLRGADLRGADLRGARFGAGTCCETGGSELMVRSALEALAPPESPVAATHRWAHAYQSVRNLGGHSYLNVWDPAIGANQVFSLSQHWYVAGSGSGLQTAEVGWQVYPQMYGNTKPVFFIYWTADNYQSTGCYNLTCTAFVQTNKSWAIGGALSPWSIPGGQQYEVQVAFYLYQGRWWLYVGGEAGSNAIGYYPASIYRNGAMASGATSIDYGGETVGTSSWPPMGSGALASAGWQHAAYQRDIRYYPPGGGTANAGLAGSATSRCYTVSVALYNPPWNETIFFGGPGGNNC
ncbi:neprosin family prolyl endopeptidase [Caballeronia sp. KNU42]